jgi:DNA-directed RNA polymerase specialized sigma24 family protein/ribosome-associated translation inhibitor RaiA
MKTDYRAVNLTLTDRDRRQIDEELSRIESTLRNFADPIAHVDVERSARKGGFGVSVHIGLPTRPLFATAWGVDLRAALELVSDKVVRQAKKHVELLRRERRAGADSLRDDFAIPDPSHEELETARDLEDFRDHVAHHASRLNEVLKRERLLNPRIMSAGGAVSIPDIAEDALVYVFEHFRDKPAQMSPDRWLVRRGLLLLDAELERVEREATGEGEAPPVFEPQEDWEEIMDLPAFALAGLEGTEADASQANPEILGDRNLAQQATAAALQSLSDRHRKALVLRHLEGYALPEIAYVLNSSEEQADNWLNEAEVRLQERLRSWRPS